MQTLIVDTELIFKIVVSMSALNYIYAYTIYTAISFIISLSFYIFLF